MCKKGIIVVFLLSLVAVPAFAVTVPGVFNTGVDANGDALGDLVLDPHWTLTSSADPTYDGPETYTVKSDEWPIPPWMANDSNSMWICPRQDSNTVVEDGVYVYQLQFDMTDYDPGSANMTGQYASDDRLNDVKINGVSTGYNGIGFDSWHGFSISSGFTAGINTLEFFVLNGSTEANPSGLRVELSVTADALPPEASYPGPADNGYNVLVDANLSWIAGFGATSHDVYFGTNENDVNNAGRLLADINGDGPVSYPDIGVINEQWLTNPAGLDPSADVDGNNDVNLVDYAFFADDWLEPPDVQFKGNQPVENTTYDLPTLSLNTTYYWRVDEVNGGGETVKGDVWEFKTSPVLDPSPRAHWKFDDGFGTTAADSSGNGNPGTLYNWDVNDTSWIGGKIDGALLFDGVDSYVQVGDDAALSFGTGSFSLSLWIKTTNFGTRRILQKGTSADPGGRRYTIPYQQYRVYFDIDDGVTKTNLNSSSDWSGPWVHVVAVRDRATDRIYLYRDGQVDCSTSDNTNGSIDKPVPLMIGKDEVGSGAECFKGLMDDIRFYDYALLQPQIEAIYNLEE